MQKAGVAVWETGVAVWEAGAAVWEAGVAVWEAGVAMWEVGVAMVTCLRLMCWVLLSALHVSRPPQGRRTSLASR